MEEVLAATTITRTCSTDGCSNTAAFKTRSKPAWCSHCIDGILREGGLQADEPFTSPKDWRLTTCLDCGVQAHYRFEYTLAKNAEQEKTCRACYWTEWAKQYRLMAGEIVPRRTYTREEITDHLVNNGFDLVATIAESTDDYEPIITRCRSCQKLAADRMVDVGWGCTCTRNIRSRESISTAANQPRNIRSSNPAAAKTIRQFLADSDDPALAWWDHERNDEKALRTATLRATRSCYWVCPECGRSFSAKVLDMTAGRASCPDCSALRQAEWDAEYERWKITPVADVPELAASWADKGDPRTVMVAGHILRRFRCPAGHHPRISPLTFMRSGCPSCRGAQTRKTQKNWLAHTLPEIASQWHPTRNGKLTPENVVWDSQRTVWWKAECCGYEWEETPRDRDKYDRMHCRQCRTILGSLAWQDPGLAAEWSAANPRTAWQVRPYASTPFVPEWICSTNPEHVWKGSLAGRSNGAQCPECKVAGKSNIELAHHAVAKQVFTGVRSGAVLRDRAFTTRRSWTADITANLEGRTLVIEYDGAYWHSAPAKMLTDERKSTDFLAAGYFLVRLREDELPALSIEHPRYFEVRVYSSAPQPEAVMERIQVWLGGLPQR